MKHVSTAMPHDFVTCQHIRRNGSPCTVRVRGTTEGFCYLHDPKKSSIVFIRDCGKFKVGESMKSISGDKALPYIEGGCAVYLSDFLERVKEVVEGIPDDVKRLIQRDDQPSLIAFFRGRGPGKPSRSILLRFLRHHTFTAGERTYLRTLLRQQGWLGGGEKVRSQPAR